MEAKIEPYDPKPIIELKGKTVKEANPKTHMEYNLEPVVAPEPPITDMQKHVLDCIKRGKIDALKSCGLDPDNVSQEFDDFHGTSFLHFAASCGKPDIVSFLLQLGADPTIKTQKKNQKAYDVSATKEVRDEFRRFMGSFPDRWDYSKTSIPGPLTDEIEQRQKEKERERRKKEKERKKLNKSNSSIVVEQKPSSSRRAAGQSISKTELQSIGMSSELRAKLDREKRYYLVI